MSNDPYEVLRLKYKPEKVKVLLVGEAGGTFFYNGNSNLARHTQDAFETAFGVPYRTPDEFLEDFKRRGFFLDDLCQTPVNGLLRPERKTLRRKSVPSLAQRIRSHAPAKIICVMMGILPNVQSAAIAASFPTGHIHGLPFPAMGHQRAYVARLAHMLPQLT